MATMYGDRANAQPGCVSGPPGRYRMPRTSSGPTSGPPRFELTLDSLIQAEIIPRLLIAHPASSAARSGAADLHAIERGEVERFAPLPLVLEADELLYAVEQFLARGVSVESIFVDLLAPSARRLGQFWEDDACDFIDVTMGLWRLQEVMREIAMRVPAVAQALAEPRSALFTPMPGEQHSFGVLMVEEVFSRAGWRSVALVEPHRQELLRTLAARNFDVVGLTVSCDCPSGALPELITAMRCVSKNPAIQVLIGGRVVNANPDLAARVGADGTAPDARSALELAEAKVPGSRMLERMV